MNNNQYDQNGQYQQNPQYDPNAQYNQNYNQYQQNTQYDPNAQYNQNYNQYQQNTQYNQNAQYNQNYNQYQQNGQYQQPNGSNGGSFMDKVKDFIFNTPVEKEPISQQDIESNKYISLVAYLGVLFWVPLVASSNSKFARFHANQGLLFCLASLVISVASTIVYNILDLIPFIGPILALIISIAIYVADLGWMILGIYNSVKGRANELPLIGKFRIIKTSAISGGYNTNNYNNNANNNYNVNNNYNANNYNNQNNFDVNAYSNGTQNAGFDANAYSNGTQNAGFDANAYSNGTQNAGFDTNAYSNGVPQQNTGFDANAYNNSTQNTGFDNNGNV